MCLNLTSFLNHYSSFRKLYILLVGGWIPLMSSYVLNPLFLCQLNYLFNSLLTFSWLNRSLLIISLLQSSSSSNKVSTRSDCNSAEKSKTLANYMINFMYCASMHAWFIYCLYYSIKYNIFFKHYNQSSSFSTLCISYIYVKLKKKVYYKLQKFRLDWIHIRFSRRLISYEVGLVLLELLAEKLHKLGRYHLCWIPLELLQRNAMNTYLLAWLLHSYLCKCGGNLIAGWLLVWSQRPQMKAWDNEFSWFYCWQRTNPIDKLGSGRKFSSAGKWRLVWTLLI